MFQKNFECFNQLFFFEVLSLSKKTIGTYGRDFMSCLLLVCSERHSWAEGCGGPEDRVHLPADHFFVRLKHFSNTRWFALASAPFHHARQPPCPPGWRYERSPVSEAAAHQHRTRVIYRKCLCMSISEFSITEIEFCIYWIVIVIVWRVLDFMS